MKKTILNPIGMVLSGAALGAISVMLDVYTQNLGNMLSQLAVWILLGVLISIYSATPKQAMVHVLVFCLGMLAAYYAVVFAWKDVYNRNFVIGWTVIALFSPIFAYIAWMTKRKGTLAVAISVGIVLVSLLSSIVLFDRLRAYDLVINAILVYFLFFKQVER